MQCWPLGTQPGQPGRTRPYIARIPSFSIVGSAQPRWSPNLSLPQPQNGCHGLHYSGTFLLNRNSRMWAGAEPLCSHRVTVVHRHVLSDGGSGGLPGASKTGCPWCMPDAEGRRHTRVSMCAVTQKQPCLPAQWRPKQRASCWSQTALLKANKPLTSEHPHFQERKRGRVSPERELLGESTGSQGRRWLWTSGATSDSASNSKLPELRLPLATALFSFLQPGPAQLRPLGSVSQP